MEEYYVGEEWSIDSVLFLTPPINRGRGVTLGWENFPFLKFESSPYLFPLANVRFGPKLEFPFYFRISLFFFIKHHLLSEYIFSYGKSENCVLMLNLFQDTHDSLIVADLGP